MKYHIDSSTRIAWCGFMCFAIALLMPCLQVRLFTTSPRFTGWDSLVWAVSIGRDLFVHFPTTGIRDVVMCMVIGLCGLMNMMFIIVPIGFVCGVLVRERWYFAVAGVFGGGGLSLLAPFLFENSHVLGGYFVWLLGYVMLLVALVVSRRKAMSRAGVGLR